MSMKTNKGGKCRRRWFDSTSGVWVKECPTCELTKPLDQFKKDSRGSVSLCLKCHSAASVRTRNPEKRRERSGEWARRNPEKTRATRAAHYSKNRDSILRRCREDEERKNQLRAANSRRRARKRTTQIEPVTPLQIIERDGCACYLCGRELTFDEVTLDHVTPLARGGTHTADNLRVACMTCNKRKHTKLIEEMQAA